MKHPHDLCQKRSHATCGREKKRQIIMSIPNDRPATWFVTGTARGLGLELAVQVLERGDNLAATPRSVERLISALAGRVDTAKLLARQVDLRDPADVARASEQTTARFGALHVVRAA